MRYLIAVFYFLVVQNSFAQIIEGRYVNSNQFLEFKGDSLNFSIHGSGGLIINYKGIGSYEVIENFLIIHTGEFNGPKSSFQKIDNQDVSCIFVSDIIGNPIIGATIRYLKLDSKIIGGTVTSEDGAATIHKDKNIAKLSVSYLGYDGLIIDYSPSYNYQVNMHDGEIIEFKVVVFRINKSDGNSLNLTLLSVNIDENFSLKELKSIANKEKDYNVDRINFVKY